MVVLATLLGARVLKHLSRSPRYQFPYAGTLHVPRLKLLRGVAFGFVSGILSAHCLLLAKSAVELVVKTIAHSNQFNRWQSWVILIVMICLALTQLYYLHRGLKVCSTSVLYPFVFCVYNIIAILDGLIYFHQAAQLSGLHAGLIALGTVVLLSGVLCLSWRLEEPSGVHPGVSAVPPTQTSLAPGMGLIDDTSQSPRSSGLLYPTDEESRPGERQPLLTPQQRNFSAHQRTPSLPLVSPYHQATASPKLEAAEIWAELDDDDDEETEVEQSLLGSHSSLQPPGTPPLPPRFLRSQKRYRSKSSTVSSIIPGNDPRRRSLDIDDGHSFSPLAKKTQTLDPRLLHPTGVGISRRTSAPVVVHPHPHPRQRRRARQHVPFTNGRTSLDSIGQEGSDEGDGERDDAHDLEDGVSNAPPSSRRSRRRSSAGSGGGWRTGFGWLRRLTGRANPPRDSGGRDADAGGGDNNPDQA